MWSEWALSPSNGERVNKYSCAICKCYTLLVKPVIQFLGKYAEKIIEAAQINLCIKIFIAALLLILKDGKQPKCPTIEDWLNKLWYRQVKNMLTP